jgi:2-polyprenyl-3-methyl-5-hydroxy-6-metoxy-1,4-benzoquinol methylase
MRGRVLGQIQHLVMPATLYASGKRLIELGSGRGHLLSTLQSIGYDVQGLEFSVDAVAQSRTAYPVPVFEGTVEQFLSAGHPADFDIALACTVIEHVDEPDVFVDACASLLKTRGILVMDMPNIDSSNAQDAGSAWDMYQKYHVYLFSPITIKFLLERHRFEVIQTFTYDNYHLNKRAILELKRMRQKLLFLDCIGLYPVVRSWYRSRQRQRSRASDTFRPITVEEIEGLKPYEKLPDAKRPLASRQQGDHLVIIARKV